MIEKGDPSDPENYECYRLMARPTPGATNAAVARMQGMEVQDGSFYAYTLRYTPRLDDILAEPTSYLISTTYDPSRRGSRSNIKAFDLRDDRRFVDVMFE